MMRAGLMIAAGFGAILLAGCGKSKPVAPGVDAYAGTWLEAREAATGGRFAPPEPKTPNLRRMTINADKSFKMEMVTPGGAATNPPEAVSGTWDFQNGVLLFTVSENTLNARYKDYAPKASGGVATEADGSLSLFISSEDEDTARFKKAG